MMIKIKYGLQETGIWSVKWQLWIMDDTTLYNILIT